MPKFNFMKVADLKKDEYLQYFQPYINQIDHLNMMDGLIEGLELTLSFYKSIAEEKQEYRYAEGKWTIKEIVIHLIDSERVFCYRALRFARKDRTKVAGFEQDDYVIASDANSRSFDDLLSEYIAVRNATILLFKSFSNTMLLEKGIAGSGEVSVRALGFLIAGHEKHHCNIIRERYLLILFFFIHDFIDNYMSICVEL